jgi:hypothetical protein
VPEGSLWLRGDVLPVNMKSRSARSGVARILPTRLPDVEIDAASQTRSGKRGVRAEDAPRPPAAACLIGSAAGDVVAVRQRAARPSTNRFMPLGVLDRHWLVGREYDLGALTASLEARRPSLVVGQSGVGKLAVLREMARRRGRTTSEGGGLSIRFTVATPPSAPSDRLRVVVSLRKELGAARRGSPPHRAAPAGWRT